MHPDTPEDKPVALPGLQNYPALIIGFLLACLAGLKALLDGGGLADGLSLNEVISIVLPALSGVLIHTQVFAQSTVDKLVPRSLQRQVIESGVPVVHNDAPPRRRQVH